MNFRLQLPGDLKGRAILVIAGALVCQMGLGFGYVFGPLAPFILEDLAAPLSRTTSYRNSVSSLWERPPLGRIRTPLTRGMTCGRASKKAGSISSSFSPRRRRRIRLRSSARDTDELALWSSTEAQKASCNGKLRTSPTKTAPPGAAAATAPTRTFNR